MTYSEACVDLVKQSEGKRNTAYQDAVGVWTIGYGHTGPEVVEGLEWTDAQCDAQLACDLQIACEGMQKLVVVPLTQGQTDALTDFVFNMGAGNFKGSTLRRQLNLGNYEAAKECLYWVDSNNEQHGWIYANGRILPGLVTRRQREQALWGS